jgi:hypothetical protein
MGEYGIEFVNARQNVPEDTQGARDFDFTQRLLSLFAIRGPRTIYFAPWYTQPRDPNDSRWRQPPGYQIGKDPRGRVALDAVSYPDGRERRTLIVPPNVTLWFAPGAYLELGDDVALIIQGNIRAEATQIFLLPDVLALRTTPWQDPATVRRESAIVRLETTAIERVYPEWFGVLQEERPSSVNAAANSRALQACIHAACRDRTRGVESLPPLTVVCQGIYSINETMHAVPTINGHGALWLEGIGDSSTRGLGIPTINRYPAGEPTAWRFTPGDPDQVPLRDQTLEAKTSALLSVHARVSLEVSGVGLRCLAWNRGEERALRVDVAYCLLLEGNSGGFGPLASRHAFIERCGMTGGSEAVVYIPERADEDGNSPNTKPARSGASGRGSRYVLRGCALDPVLSPLQDLRETTERLIVPARSSRFVIRAALDDASMLDLIGGKVHQTVGALYGAQVGVIDNQAGVWLRAGSTFIRSVSFHLDEGPRPSRPADQAHLPDGQDLWLDAGADGRFSHHLTVLHADSQSWWFLGGTRCADGNSSAVSLLNVGANDVNIDNAMERGPNRHELNRPYLESRMVSDQEQRERLFLPPALMWPGGRVPLLLLACFFDRYCTAPDNGRGLTFNVGTAFRLGLNLDHPSWMTPEVIPRPRTATSSLHDDGAPVIKGRPIPVLWRGAGRFNLYPLELQGRSTLNWNGRV